MDQRLAGNSAKLEQASDTASLLGELVSKLQAMQRSHGQLTLETQRSVADLQKLRQIDKSKLDAALSELDQEKRTNGLLTSEVRRLQFTVDSLKNQADERHSVMMREANQQENHELIDRIARLATDNDQLKDKVGSVPV